MRTVKAILICFNFVFIIPWGPAANADVRWHHSASPFRAAYRIERMPTIDKAGVFLHVPVCGIGDADGRGIYAFDGVGRKLPIHALGRSRDNTALTVVGLPQDGRDIYAYWGSKSRSLQAPGAFKPGLTVDIRTCDPGSDVSSWERVDQLLNRSRRIAIVPVAKIALATNPIDTSDAFLMVFEGYWHSDTRQEWQIFLVSDDAGYLFVHKKLVIDRSGSRRAHDACMGQGRQPIRVRQGTTRIRCIVADIGGAQMAVLAQWIDDRNKYTVPSEAYVRSGSAQLVNMENRDPDRMCPAFSVKQISYIGIDNVMLTEIEMSTYTEQAAAWRLGNGSTASGNRVRRIVIGTDSMSVSAASESGKPRAEGQLHFGPVPRQLSWTDAKVYGRYSRTILEQNLEDIDAETLTGYYHFLNLRERNPGVVPICRALVDGPSQRLNRELSNEVLLSLARAASAGDPDLARRAYKRRMADGRSEDAESVMLEQFQFELYRRRDYKSAERVVNRVVKRLGCKNALARLCVGELALDQGDLQKAKKYFNKLYKERSGRGDFENDVVRSNAVAERLQRNIDQTFWAAAEKDLREWPVLAPEILWDGRYALWWARLLNAYGWHEGAVTVIDNFIAFNDLPAVLPAMELEKALGLRSLERRDDADALLRRIIEEFPKHPAADAARRRVGG